MGMKEFKIFNVFDKADEERMEEWVSTYLSDHWKMVSFDSTPKKSLEGENYTEYRVIMDESGED